MPDQSALSQSALSQSALSQSALSPGLAPDVVVGIATFRRPEELGRMLPAVIDQCAALEPPAHVVVVDNDPDGGASWVRAEYGGAVTYAHESAPGIAAARNRAIDVARALGARAVVFIDDDEYPQAGWLAGLVNAWQRWTCAAVAGPVDAEFAASPSEWVLASGFFRPRAHRDGAAVQGAATNNLLLDLAALQQAGLSFDSAFGLSGGSDTMLTRAMTSTGLQIRWCAQARVSEIVPAARTSRRWILQRELRTGNDWSRVHLVLAGDSNRLLRTRAALAGKGLLRAGKGVVRVLGGLAGRSLSRRAAGEQDLAAAAGMLLGVIGRTRTEYRRA